MALLTPGIPNPYKYLDMNDWTQTLYAWKGQDQYGVLVEQGSIWKFAVGSVAHLAVSALALTEMIGHLSTLALFSIGSLFSKRCELAFEYCRINITRSIYLAERNLYEVILGPFICTKMTTSYLRFHMTGT